MGAAGSSTATVTYGDAPWESTSAEPAAVTTEVNADLATSPNLLEATLVRTHSATVVAIPDDEDDDDDEETPHDNFGASLTPDRRQKIFKWPVGILVLLAAVVAVGIFVPIMRNANGSDGSQAAVTTTTTTSPTPATPDGPIAASVTNRPSPSATLTTLPPTKSDANGPVSCRIDREVVPSLVPAPEVVFCEKDLAT